MIDEEYNKNMEVDTLRKILILKFLRLLLFLEKPIPFNNQKNIKILEMNEDILLLNLLILHLSLLKDIIREKK
jgi:hypothetical protein